MTGSCYAVAQSDLKLKSSCLSLFSAGLPGVCHQAWSNFNFQVVRKKKRREASKTCFLLPLFLANLLNITTSGNNEHLYISIHEGEVILPGLTWGGTHRHQEGRVSRGDNNPSHYMWRNVREEAFGLSDRPPLTLLWIRANDSETSNHRVLEMKNLKWGCYPASEDILLKCNLKKTHVILPFQCIYLYKGAESLRICNINLEFIFTPSPGLKTFNQR